MARQTPPPGLHALLTDVRDDLRRRLGATGMSFDLIGVDALDEETAGEIAAFALSRLGDTTPELVPATRTRQQDLANDLIARAGDSASVARLEWTFALPGESAEQRQPAFLVFEKSGPTLLLETTAAFAPPATATEEAS